MKYMPICKGDSFSLRGQILTFIGNDSANAIVQDARTGKKYIYGNQALQKLMQYWGYELNLEETSK